MSELVELNSMEAGEAGPVVVLLHGLNESMLGYKSIMEELSNDLHLYAVDLRGHGGSEWQTPYRIPDYASDVTAFIEGKIGSAVIVAGHSLGGLVGAFIAAQSPEHVNGLLLEDPPFYSAQMPALSASAMHGVFVFVRELMRQHQLLEGTIDSMELILGQLKVDTPQGEAVPIGTLYGEDYVSRLAEELDCSDPRTLDYVLGGELFEGFSPDKDLPKIRCQTHLLAGRLPEGSALSDDEIERVAGLIPNCTPTAWEGVGNDIHHLRPREYARELLAFVCSLELEP